MSAPTRKLAAILAADVAGYSKLMGEDESGTLKALRELRNDLFQPTVSKHRGEVVKSMGDGWLAEFTSVADAVTCAIEVQEELAGNEVIKLRVGVHLGDITHEDDDIYGDGVNIAARLQEIAEPGSIVISDITRRSIDGKLAAAFVDLGAQDLKNIAEAIIAYGWGMTALVGASTALPLPDKPSIAVLPFDNMSGDPEQEYFADGIAEDVITALSRFRSLFVIARNSSFTYKGNAVEITQVARDLGVRYVVEGSVRKAGNRVRITAQLIDATSGNHLWADRFDGALDDIFDLQDQITEQIVVAVEPEIEASERDRARRKPPENLNAWAHFQRGLSHFYRINKDDNEEAIRLFAEAVELDPTFAAAHAYHSYANWFGVPMGFSDDQPSSLAEAREAAERAVAIDPQEPLAHFSLGRLHIFTGAVDMAIREMQTAVNCNPNSARAHYGLGFACHYGGGQLDQALSHYDAALRLSPRDPMRWLFLTLKGEALRTDGRYDEAISHCQQACQFPDCGFISYMHLAASLVGDGRDLEALSAIERAKAINPELSIGFLRDRFVGMHETLFRSLLDSLRKAGLPEE